jgi:hypothetical protein
MKLRDADIRPLLFDLLDERHGKVRTYEELYIGDCRADVYAVLPDRTVGFEIKSDADTYTRLKTQVRWYNRYFDYNYIVIGTSHAMHIDEHIPDWWGIITAEEDENGIDLYTRRYPLPNPKRKLKDKLSLLWRPELTHIQERNKMFRYKEKSKLFVQEKILEKIPEDLLHQEISRELFERDYTMIEQELEAYRNAG